MSILKVANIHFETAGTNRIDYLGDDKVRINSGNGTVFSGSTTDALLRITQTGTGDAIRVEDDTNPDSTPFIVSATGNVGIGIINPNTFLHISSSDSTNIFVDSYNSGSPRFVGRAASGTASSPTAIGANQELAQFGGRGYGSTGFSATAKATVTMVAAETWTDSAQGTYIRFDTVITGDNSRSERMRIDPTGNLLISRTDSTVGLGVKLDVNGAINCSNIFVNGNAVGGGASISVTDQSSVTPLQYLTFSTTTSGTASSLNVATTKLTFNVATGTLSSTVFNSTSDINQKENITLVTDSLDIIDALNGVRFTWKDNGLPSLGVIAQEVEKVLPELVSDEKSVNYNGIIAVLIEAVKELKAEIEVLKSK